jgi:hypothetical protein
MSFFNAKEKVLMDKFIKAEEIRKEKFFSRRYLKFNAKDLRGELKKAGERIYSLERSIMEINTIRQKKGILKELQKSNEKSLQFEFLRENVLNSIKQQEAKLKVRSSTSKYFKGNLPVIDRNSPESPVSQSPMGSSIPINFSRLLRKLPTVLENYQQSI